MDIYKYIFLPIITGIIIAVISIAINKIFSSKSSKILVCTVIIFTAVAVILYISLENKGKTESSNVEVIEENETEIEASIDSYKQTILKKIQQYEDAGNTEDVISYINTLEKEYQNDNDIKLKYDVNVDSFREMTLNRAKDVFESEGVESAVEIINDGLNILPEDKAFLDKIEEYRSYIPIALFEMQILYKNGDDFLFSHVGSVNRPDNVGNMYSASAYEIYASGDDRSVTYALDQKYTLLTGTLAIRQNSGHESVWVEFYDGDILLGRTDEVCDGVRPISFEISVAGVTDLTIKARTNASYGFAYTEGFYVQK